MHSHLLPENWAQPKGYVNGVLCDIGQTLYIGGQIGWNENCEFETDDFVDQVEQTLNNIKALLNEANAKPEHMARMTWYLTSKTAYIENLRPIGQVYKRIMGKNYPSMSVVMVVALVEDRAQVEIEVTAVIPRLS
jgi:enamine deaminase RidA (YjgF/YER057c/UK114 family)